MNKYLHYAHLMNVVVGKGDTVTKGQIIGYIGKSGGQEYAHLHFEVRTTLYGGFTFYPNWLTTKKWINQNYHNPGVYLAQSGIAKPMAFDHLGYEYLSWTGKQYHPGWDMNEGAGDADLGMCCYATENGKIIDINTQASGYGLNLTMEGLGLGISDDDIKRLYAAIWQREPAYGDWFYFRRRLQLNTIHDEQDLMVKILYCHDQFIAQGDQWWQKEKTKVLSK
jgi:hypothetical protein